MPAIPPFSASLIQTSSSATTVATAARLTMPPPSAAVRVAGVPAPVVPGTVLEANPLIGIAHLLELAGKRDRFWGPQVQRLRTKLSDIFAMDRSSAAAIGAEALTIKGPNTERLKLLIWAVHKTHTRLKRWPSAVGREGPVAAFYIKRRNDSEGRDRLQRQLIQPSTERISFDPETGAFTVTDRPFVSEIDPLAMIREDDEAAANLTPALIRGLNAVFSQLLTLGLVDASRDFANLCRRIGIFLRYDTQALAVWLQGFEAERKVGRMGRTEWHRYRRALYAASDFVNTWRGRVAWRGDPVAYFLANIHDLKTLRKFYHRVEKGTVRSICFEAGEARLESMFPVRRSHTMAATGYSYRDAAHVRFLPGPSNGWGERDFAQSEERLAERIQSLFERIEKRQGLTPAVIQRTLKIPYYFIRTARTGMAPAYMEDKVLDRLDMTEAEKEKLRHLQTLLALARDRRKDVESGPYREQGRLLWYYRWLHQIHQRAMQALYRSGVAQEGVTEIELGRARIDDRGKLTAIAEAIGVPAGCREEFVDHLLRGYESVRARMAGRPEVPEHRFPNATWSVPLAHFSDDEIDVTLKALREKFTLSWSRQDRIDLSGLHPSAAHALALHGTLWAAALEAVFRRDGLTEEADQLRVLRAAHELRRKPVEDRGAYHRAGRLLRFARLMMPGWAAEDVIRELKLEMRTPAYTYWEWGYTRMPDRILTDFSHLLVRRGVLPPDGAEAFIKHIRALCTE